MPVNLTPVQRMTVTAHIQKAYGLETRADAEEMLGVLIEEGVISNHQSNEDRLNAINIHSGYKPPKPKNDIDDFINGNQPEAPSNITALPESPAPSQPQQPQSGGGRGQAVIMPNGGARLWRRFNDEDIEFFITPDTDMVALFDNLAALMEKTPKAAWIAKKELAEPAAPPAPEYRHFKPGEEIVIGKDNRINATPITSISMSRGPKKAWMHFHDGTVYKSGKNEGGLVSVASIEATDENISFIEQVTGQSFDKLGGMTGTNLLVTVKLGNLKTTTDLATGKTVYQNDTFVSSFYCSLVDVKAEL